MLPGPVRTLGAYARRNWKRALLAVFVLAALAVGGAVAYFETPHRSQGWATDAVDDTDGVTLSKTGGDYVLAPADRPRRGTLVFYPGGRVHPDAYLHTLVAVAADANVRVVVPKVPLNLALTETGAAGDYVGDGPLFVGGHSLGGPAACRYADANPGQVDGLVLFASYCDVDVSDHAFDAVSLTGSRDAVMDRERYRETRTNLPENRTFVELEGVNHSQFGAYTGQRGGQPATVSYRAAHDRVDAVLVPWMQNRTESTG
jgi:dienelactone hydrolase